jgi:ubiquinone/menaquinone biosynthesis C-methylase UbiE
MLDRIPYCDPLDQGPLLREATGFRNPRTGVLYPIHHEMPVFVPADGVQGPNARYQSLYDHAAMLYDLSTRLYAWWKSGDEATRRHAYLDLLEIPDGASVLEVSVGTGANWSHLNRKADFYGLDLSAGMLARCLHRARRLKLRFQLCQGLAEHLPYPSSAFDCVFHMGGINFFTDPGAALREMVRVAKPGSRLVVADETEDLAQRHEDKFLAKAFFKNRPRIIVAPVDLLPAGMEQVKVEEIWNHELYILSFRKPK